MKINILKNKIKGQSLVEYSLIMSLVSIVVIAAMLNMGQNWKIMVNNIQGRLQQANQLSQQNST